MYFLFILQVVVVVACRNSTQQTSFPWVANQDSHVTLMGLFVSVKQMQHLLRWISEQTTTSTD